MRISDFLQCSYGQFGITSTKHMLENVNRTVQLKRSGNLTQLFNHINQYNCLNI